MMMKTRQAMQERKAKVRRQLKIIETIAWAIFVACCTLMIIAAAGVDCPQWKTAIVVFVGAGLSCWLAYKAATWAHDQEV